MKASTILAFCLAIVLASCGNPEVSGIYLHASDRKVILVQLVEAKDGTVTGRLEEVTISDRGVVSDKTIPLDGVASDENIVFKPVSAWFGGLQASGTVNSNVLSIVGSGTQLSIRRSNLEEYKAAIARLHGVAETDRKRIVENDLAIARRASLASAIQAVENRKAALEDAALRLREESARLQQVLSKSPDFTQAAANNTGRIARMLQAAGRLSEGQRSQLAVEASQIEVGTNQIEVARSQFAYGLNDIVGRAGQAAQQVMLFCKSPPGAQSTAPCANAKAAEEDFRATIANGEKTFGRHKLGVQGEIEKQQELIRRIDRMQ